MTIRFLGPLIMIALGLATASLAQPANLVCQTLSQRLAQAPRALEGRLLHEALFEAAALDCLKIALDLIDRGASVEARNRRGATPLNVAADKGALDVARMLIEKGADLHHEDLSGATPLLEASRAGRRTVASLLIDTGADVNGADKRGITPLMAAAFEGDRRLFRLLLDAGGDPSMQDFYGKGALIYAAGRGYAGIVADLINAGAEVDGRWGNDLTPLMWAAGHANDTPAIDGIEVARLLIAAGAKVKQSDDRGRTPLMIAAERGHLQMVEFLIENGADPAAVDKNGLNAADLAATNAVREAVMR